MKNIFFFVLTLSLIVPAQIRIGIGAGVTTILSPNKFINENINLDEGFGYSSELHVSGKLYIHKDYNNFFPIGFAYYNLFNGSQNDNGRTYKSETKIFSFGLGIEKFLMKGSISPYLNMSIAFNRIGDLEVATPERLYTSPLPNTNSLSDRSRGGLLLGIGVETGLLPIDIDFNIQYHILNLIGKTDNEETISSIMFTGYLVL